MNNNDSRTQRKSITLKKVVITLVIMAILFLVWAELGVGVFGTPWAGD